MQRLSSLFVVFLATFAGLFSTSCVNAQTSQPTVMDSIKDLTTASANLRTTCDGVTVINVLFVGPQIGAGLANIGIEVTKVVSMITSEGLKPFPDDVAVEIVGVLTTFVEVHQMLLATIIGKHGILAQFGFAMPIRVALVSLEQAVDAFAVALIKLIPTRASDGTSAKSMLDTSLMASVAAYS